MVKGFKHTEVGFIPNDWNDFPLGKYAKLINGRAYALHEWKLQGTPVIRLQNLTGSGDKFYYSNLKLPDKQYCKNGDLLFMWSATFGPVIWKGERAIYHYHIWKVETDEKNLDRSFLYHILEEVTERVKKNSTNGGTMLHLTKGGMEVMPIPLPPTKAEQTAIATALNDADALIQKLEQLLAKKRNIKTGAMQELLRPKEGWEEKVLGEVIKLQGGYAFKSELFNEIGVPIIRISDVNSDRISTENSVRYEPFNISREYVAKNGDLLIAMSGATTGKIGIYLSKELAYINQRVGKFVILNSGATSQEFISHIVRSELFKEGLSKLLAQGAQPNISGKQIESIQFTFPKTKSEQTRIAEILTDMDNEIQELEKKIEKYKMLKQGMMQNLLTGKIRLV